MNTTVKLEIPTLQIQVETTTGLGCSPMRSVFLSTAPPRLDLKMAVHSCKVGPTLLHSMECTEKCQNDHESVVVRYHCRARSRMTQRERQAVGACASVRCFYSKKNECNAILHSKNACRSSDNKMYVNERYLLHDHQVVSTPRMM